MEDVIFAGNTGRKPLGMAEVTLTFDNDDHALPLDFAQVQITRRAYRAGDSEYFINRNHVRLRDVVELLMGTGLGPGSYAIVSQGQIDAILSSKPTERRSLFEETAGIAKFLARKAEAMRRLDAPSRTSSASTIWWPKWSGVFPNSKPRYAALSAIARFPRACAISRS